MVTIEKLKQALTQIYRAALGAVDPEKAVANHLKRDQETLRVAGHSYSLSNFRKIFLIGAGKAGVPMARAVESVLGDRLERGIVIVKYGHGGVLKKTSVLEAGHPEPDEQGVVAAAEILRLLDDELTGQDLLLVVISGGGSALLPSPVPEVSFADKRQVTSVLLKCGATIQEMNAIRKHLSRIKGGRLLDHTQDARVLTLMVSDVIGDDLASIASGPTVPDPTTFSDCLEIVERYKIRDELPPAVVEYLRSGWAGNQEETPKPGDPRFEKVQNGIVAGNIHALKAAAEKADALGFRPLVLSSTIYGNTADAARFHVAVAQEILRTGNPLTAPCCLISGGETTVRVLGPGKGGRNQEFVLWCAREIAGWPERSVLFASLGSDGTDGPTDAAGAWASPETATRAKLKDLSIQDHLDRNDSYHFFKELGDLIITGPTQTNVMDLRFVLIQ